MILDEQYLREISLLTALLTGLLSAGLLLTPAKLSSLLFAFPRNRVAGIALTALSLLWSAYLINQMTLGELSKYKDLLFVLTPATFFLIIYFIDELLAARAFGGLLMLYPTLMVDIARWHPSPWRLVVVSVAYLMVVAGMWIVLSPYKFRLWTHAMLCSRTRQKLAGSFYALLTGLLLATAYMAG